MYPNYSMVKENLLECPYCSSNRNQVVALLRVLNDDLENMIHITVKGHESVVSMRQNYIYNVESLNMHILYKCEANNHYYCSSVDTSSDSTIFMNSNQTFYRFADYLTSDYQGQSNKELFDFLVGYFTKEAARSKYLMKVSNL